MNNHYEFSVFYNLIVPNSYELPFVKIPLINFMQSFLAISMNRMKFMEKIKFILVYFLLKLLNFYKFPFPVLGVQIGLNIM